MAHWFESNHIPAALAILRVFDIAGKTPTHAGSVFDTAQSFDSVRCRASVEKIVREAIRTNRPRYSTGDLADSIGTYIYPVPFSPLSSVGKAVDRVRALQPSQLRPLVGLQGFSLRDTNQNPGGRKPTAQETRFMAFQAIVHGAGGLIWWGANFISSESTLWTAIKQTSRDVSTISGWLVEADSPFQIQAAGVETLLKQPIANGDTYLLIAVNPQDTSQNVEFSLLAPKTIKTAREIFTQQQAAVSEGRFTESFEAYGVRVYEITIADAS